MSGGTFNNNGAFTPNSSSELDCYDIGGINAFNNAGTFTKQGSGLTTFRVVSTTGVRFNNSGSVDVQGGTLALDAGGSLLFSGSSVLRIEPVATFRLSVVNLTGGTTNASDYSPRGGVLFNGGGSRQLEVMSRDLGNVPAGFTNNFAYGTIELANGANVMLEDNSDNVPGPEALYVENLILRDGTTLNLAGIHLYVRAAETDGTVSGGTIAFVPDNSGPIALNSPSPGVIALAGRVGEWTFFERAGQSITVVVDTGSSKVPPPQLTYADVRLYDASNNLLARGNNAVAQQAVLLSGLTIATDGDYRVEIRAPANQPSSSGNYQVTVWEITPHVAPLVLNQTFRSYRNA